MNEKKQHGSMIRPAASPAFFTAEKA